jgi:hypothetical protein
MSLSLFEVKTIQQIANHLCDFLPGQPHPFADQKISFAGISHEIGLKEFWKGGSKLPAITSLLECTLERRRDVFCPLIIEIVRRGIKYRDSKGNPINREEIKGLNELLVKVKFKIPELWEKDFLDSLPSSKQQDLIENAQKEEKISEVKRKELCQKLFEIEKLSPQERGFAFERFLNELFGIFRLSPRSSFRITGEQIDGSLELDGETYLIEAKWENKPIGTQELLGFHGKVAGKATWSRGIFVSYSGFTDDAITAFSKGRPTNLIILTAQDIYFILEGYEKSYLDMEEAIRIKVRYAAETGNIGISVYEILTKMGKK